MVIDKALDNKAVLCYYGCIRVRTDMPGPREGHRGTAEERLYARLELAEDGCWNFVGKVHKTGYGRLQFRGHPEYTHRIAWRLWRGAIPDGLVVRHSCHNMRCCNPEHLSLGTIAENIRDRTERYKALGISWRNVCKK